MKLVSDCNLMDPITQEHGYINELETYIRGKDRIDFIFCTLNIAAFVTACGITSQFLDIRLQQFLAKSFQEVADHTSRKLQTRDSAGIVTYKEHLREFTTTHHIFNRINNLKHKLSKEQLKIEDMKEINDLDDLITKGMLASENKILKRQNQYLWSPTLEQSILEVSLWKLITSEIKKDVSKEMQIQRIIGQMDVSPLIEKVPLSGYRLPQKRQEILDADPTRGNVSSRKISSTKSR